MRFVNFVILYLMGCYLFFTTNDVMLIEFAKSCKCLIKAEREEKGWYD